MRTSAAGATLLFFMPLGRISCEVSFLAQCATRIFFLFRVLRNSLTGSFCLCSKLAFVLRLYMNTAASCLFIQTMFRFFTMHLASALLFLCTISSVFSLGWLINKVF